MQAEVLKAKLHEEIEHGDDRMLKLIYAFVQEYHDSSDDDQIAGERKKLILAERERHLKGQSKSYTWEEVKDMAINKHKRDAL